MQSGLSFACISGAALEEKTLLWVLLPTLVMTGLVSATDFCHTEELIKALLLLESSSNTSTLQVGRERHPLFIHITEGSKQINQAVNSLSGRLLPLTH